MNNIQKLVSLILLVLAGITAGCAHKRVNERNEEKMLLSFQPLQGINYTEVKRVSANGLSFNEYGYQLEPQWRLNFVSHDSVSMYSPIKKQFINLPLTCGYDSIFNIARTWLKMRKMNNDSLVLELLKSTIDSIDRSGTKVYMTFYAENYIRNRLHSTEEAQRRPSRRDTLYIGSLAEAARKDFKKAFAAREPVVLTSKSKLVQVKQRKTETSILNNFDSSDDYLSPVFDIQISKAYADFYYSFTVIIDEHGVMHYGKPLVPFTEQKFEEDYIRFSTEIMNSYLKFYLHVVPGTTLGITHASEINLHVQGNMGR